MKLVTAIVTMIFFLMLVTCVAGNSSYAQTYNCNYKEPVINIDFGTSGSDRDLNLSNVKNYQKTTGSCPDDGYYSFVSATSDCFGSRWHTLPSDHTPNDINGRMMLVNASERPGYFFVLKITGLKPGASYRISSWLVNICKYASGCYPTPPVISMAVFVNDKNLASFETGEIKQTDIPNWHQYFGEFTLPADADAITLQMKNIARGGCGNDFAMDDIELRECMLPQPEVVQKEKPGPVTMVTQPAIKPQPELKKTAIENNKKQEQLQEPENRKPMLPVPKQNPINFPVPKVIETRANPIVQQITTEATELIIELYDNGEIDGDTVSIYHNNELVVNHAGISTKPVTVKIKVDKQQPHHELVMVADNLGSIPPNTSLMIITAGKKRYEVFISSSEQKNAKVVIDLEE